MRSASSPAAAILRRAADQRLSSSAKDTAVPIRSQSATIAAPHQPGVTFVKFLFNMRAVEQAVVIILPAANDPEDRIASTLRAAFPAVAVSRFDSVAEASSGLPDVEIAMTFGALLTDDFFGRARRLRWLQLLGSGTDRVFDRPGCPPGLIVTNAAGITATPVAEAAMAYLLMLARRIPALIADQQGRRWGRHAPALLFGRRLLIVGTGRAAEALAGRARAFGMHVRAVSRAPRAHPAFDAIAPRTRLREEARDADFLVVLTGLDDSSRALVDESVVAALPHGAAVVDLSRGGIADTRTIAARLGQGTLSGAALDVFPEEPLAASSPLWDMPGLTVSPHIAGLHDRYPEFLAPLLADNLRAWFDGRPGDLANRVDPAGGRDQKLSRSFPSTTSPR
jgi:phosphoglycerate dehydrogenase-like enzyme